MRADLEFRFSLWPTLAAAAGIALTIALGNWQLESRATKKTHCRSARIGELRTGPPIAVPAAALDARGRADCGGSRRAAASSRNTRCSSTTACCTARSGYHVVMPLRLGDGEPLRAGQSRLGRGNPGPQSTAGGDDTRPDRCVISGMAVVPSKRFLELSTQHRRGQRLAEPDDRALPRRPCRLRFSRSSFSRTAQACRRRAGARVDRARSRHRPALRLCLPVVRAGRRRY